MKDVHDSGYTYFVGNGNTLSEEELDAISKELDAEGPVLDGIQLEEININSPQFEEQMKHLTDIMEGKDSASEKNQRIVSDMITKGMNYEEAERNVRTSDIIDGKTPLNQLLENYEKENALEKQFKDTLEQSKDMDFSK